MSKDKTAWSPGEDKHLQKLGFFAWCVFKGFNWIWNFDFGHFFLHIVCEIDSVIVYYLFANICDCANGVKFVKIEQVLALVFVLY